jgi:hypothetical protein
LFCLSFPRRREPIFPPHQALHDLDYEWIPACAH